MEFLKKSTFVDFWWFWWKIEIFYEFWVKWGSFVGSQNHGKQTKWSTNDENGSKSSCGQHFICLTTSDYQKWMWFLLLKSSRFSDRKARRCYIEIIGSFKKLFNAYFDRFQLLVFGLENDLSPIAQLKMFPFSRR